MDMNLITDLGSELAIAFIVEKKLSHKLGPRDAVKLIDKVTTELSMVSDHAEDNEIDKDVSPRQFSSVH